MMGEPPLLVGAVQERSIRAVPLAVATRTVGAAGTVVPVVAASTLEGPPAPWVLMAETR